ncbi:MAG: DUF1573 domain-containing protein [Polyangiaceae bacterium]
MGAGCERQRAEPAEPARPDLFIAQSEHDFGRVDQGAPIRHVFVIENRGRAPLRLLGVDKSYGCEAAVSGSVAAGARSELTVSCDSERRTGRVDDELGLRSDDARSPARLRMRGEVVPRVGFDSELVSFAPAFGEREVRRVGLRGAQASRAALQAEPVDQPGLSVSVLPATSTAPPGLELSVLGAKVGSFAGRVRVNTGLPAPSQIALSYAIDVKGNLKLESEQPLLESEQQ